MAPQQPPSQPRVPSPWQPRFGTRALFLLMLVVSVMGAGGYYLTQTLQGGGRAFQLVFILFTVAAPLLVMVVVSLLRMVLDRDRRKRR